MRAGRAIHAVGQRAGAVHKGTRDVLLKLWRYKFGDAPEAVSAKVQAINTEAELDALLERVLRANALADMGL